MYISVPHRLHECIQIRMYIYIYIDRYLHYIHKYMFYIRVLLYISVPHRPHACIQKQLPRTGKGGSRPVVAPGTTKEKRVWNALLTNKIAHLLYKGWPTTNCCAWYQKECGNALLTKKIVHLLRKGAVERTVESVCRQKIFFKIYFFVLLFYYIMALQRGLLRMCAARKCFFKVSFLF